MKLMTKEIEKKLKSRPFHSTDELGEEATVVVKYFNPCGSGTWLITEGEKQANGDWLLYGYCHIHEWEYGYVSLSALQSIRLPCGMTIERDLYVRDGATISDLSD